jgi:3D (Asp-Asp-Asp) domain-containing protein
VRVRIWRPYLLVLFALAVLAMHAAATPAATAPREHAALVALFATDAALARARVGEQAAQARLSRVRNDLRGLRARLGVARANQIAAQRALSQRLNEIYRARPVDTLGVLLGSRSWSDISAGLDLLDRLSRADSSLVLAARRWQATLRGQTRTLRAAEGSARAEEAAWQARAAELQRADRAQRALLTKLRHAHVPAVAVLAATAHRDVARAQKVVRPQPHGGGSDNSPIPPPPVAPSLATGSTLSVSSTAYSLPGHTASGLPVGQGICATDPRVIPLGTRFAIPGYGVCVAADTGSAVIGNVIDIWMPGAQANAYGSQTITITFR